MPIKAVVIPVRGDIRIIEIGRSDYRAYQDAVGGNLEVITLQSPPGSLYLDEEGKLKELPYNERATRLVDQAVPGFAGRDVVVGPALVTGPVTAGGYDTDVPADLLSRFGG